MTPQELHAALDARRRGLGWKWWQVEIAIGAPAASTVRLMRLGAVSADVRARAEAWLERRQAQPQKE